MGITRTVKYCIDTQTLTPHQHTLFARHAGTRRLMWNWALAQINEYENQIRTQVHAEALIQTNGDTEAAKKLYETKTWRTTTYKTAKKNTPPNHKFSLAGFSKQLSIQAGVTKDIDPETGKPYTGDPDSPVYWWGQEKHGVARSTTNHAFKALTIAIDKYYKEGQKPRRVSKKRKPRKDGRPANWPRFKKKTDPQQFRINNAIKDPLPAAGTVGSNHRVTFTNLGSIRVHDNTKHLRKMLKRGGRVTSYAFSNAGGKWYVSINVDFEEDSAYVQTPEPIDIKNVNIERVRGVDLGVRRVASVSDMKQPSIKVIQPGKTHAARTKKLSQALARAQKGSNRHTKLLKKIAAHSHKIAMQRAGLQHQLTKELIRGIDILVVEGLNNHNMTGSAKGTVESPGVNVAAKAGLNRSMLDAGFGEIRNQLKYKAERRGITFQTVNPKHTSQICSVCNHKDAKSRKNQTFTCTNCGVILDADINAAVNIKNRGLGMLGYEPPQGVDPRGEITTESISLDTDLVVVVDPRSESQDSQLT